METLTKAHNEQAWLHCNRLSLPVITLTQAKRAWVLLRSDNKNAWWGDKLQKNEAGIAWQIANIYRQD